MLTQIVCEGSGQTLDRGSGSNRVDRFEGEGDGQSDSEDDG